MVVGLVSGFSLANHSDSGSFLVLFTLLSRDECHREGFWEVVGHMVSLCFCFFFTIRELFWLMVAYQFHVPYFLTRNSCLKITHTDGCYGAWPGLAVLVNVFPLT